MLALTESWCMCFDWGPETICSSGHKWLIEKDKKDFLQQKDIFVLGVAWLESATHDWLMEPCASHEQGMQGSSSSALTWWGEVLQLAFTQSWRSSNKPHADVTHPVRPVESGDAGLTVDSSGVLPATNTHSAPSLLPVDVQAERQLCDRLIKVALLCLPVAVALWKTHTKLVL